IGRLIKAGESYSQPQIETPSPKVEKTASYFQKRLLSKDDVREIETKEIILEKGTIITALAKDTARELGISISFRK
ncbi:MAG: acetate kinase, partial [Kurthia sp.]